IGEEVNGAGMIPVSLIRWQLTGLDDDIRAMIAPGPAAGRPSAPATPPAPAAAAD
ncbi:MAG: hypothetical protein HW392_546, partial [Steroidobacteraceae bacterium]|nr:hypothetical protein [Steroidobacteraceae bacterium]